MANPSYIGYVGVSDTAQNHSAALTVPTGAGVCYCGISTWTSGGQTPSTITLDGQTGTLVGVTDFGDYWCHILVYRFSGFAVGSKTFVCNWPAAPTSGNRYMLMFLDEGTTRDSAIAHDDTDDLDLSSGTFDSSSSDLVLAFAAGDNGYGECTMTGGGQTEVDAGVQEWADYGCGYKAGSAATDSVTTHGSKLNVIGISVEGTAAPSAIAVKVHHHLQQQGG
jgi:hypothetical protein